jgi:hypothetical protein
LASAGSAETLGGCANAGIAKSTAVQSKNRICMTHSMIFDGDAARRYARAMTVRQRNGRRQDEASSGQCDR